MRSQKGNITVDVWWHWYNNNGLQIESQCYFGPFDLFRLAWGRVNASCFGDWSLEQTHEPGHCASHDGVHRELQPRWRCAGEDVFTLSGPVDEPNCVSRYFFQVDRCDFLLHPSDPSEDDGFHAVLISLLALFVLTAATVVLYRKGHCDGVIERWHVSRWLDRLPALSNKGGHEPIEMTTASYPHAQLDSKSGALYGSI